MRPHWSTQALLGMLAHASTQSERETSSHLSSQTDVSTFLHISEQPVVVEGAVVVTGTVVEVSLHPLDNTLLQCLTQRLMFKPSATSAQ